MSLGSLAGQGIRFPGASLAYRRQTCTGRKMRPSTPQAPGIATWGLRSVVAHTLAGTGSPSVATSSPFFFFFPPLAAADGMAISHASERAAASVRPE